jgi:hypothetical protein
VPWGSFVSNFAKGFSNRMRQFRFKPIHRFHCNSSRLFSCGWKIRLELLFSWVVMVLCLMVPCDFVSSTPNAESVRFNAINTASPGEVQFILGPSERRCGVTISETALFFLCPDSGNSQHCSLARNVRSCTQTDTGSLLAHRRLMWCKKW